MEDNNAITDLSLLEDLGIVGIDFEDSDETPEATPQKEISHIDKVKYLGGKIKTNYTDLLQRHYEKSGYTKSESEYWIEQIGNGTPQKIPFFLLPVKGVSFNWLERKAQEHGEQPATVILHALKLSKSTPVLAKQISALTAHARRIYSQADQIGAYLGRELADVLIKFQDLDKDIGTPIMDMQETIGEIFQPKVNKQTTENTFTARKYLYLELPGSEAKWLGERGAWNITGVGLAAESIIRQAKFIMEASIGEPLPHLANLSSLEMEGYTGLYKLTHTLRRIEVQITQLSEIIPSVATTSRQIIRQLDELTNPNNGGHK